MRTRLKKYNCRHISLSVTCNDLCNESGCDILHFEIVLSHDKFRMILIYRPPHSCNKVETTLHQTAALDKLLNELVDPRLLDTTIILGDFNLPSINWSNSFTKIDGIHDTIFNCMSSLGMHQIITQPTRITSTSQTSILDLIFTNDPLSTNIIDYLPPFSTSDHLMIHFSVYYHSANHSVDDIKPINTYLPKYDWSNGDYDTLNEFCSILIGMYCLVTLLMLILYGLISNQLFGLQLTCSYLKKLLLIIKNTPLVIILSKYETY